MQLKKGFVVFILTNLLALPVFSIDDEKFISEYLWKNVSFAKTPDRPKVALVLGGGGARGLAHVGVIKVLEEEHVPVDIVVGTSIGAIFGAMYAAGSDIEKLEAVAKNAGWDEVVNFSAPALINMLFTNKYFSTEKMEKYIITNIGDVRIEGLKKKFSCVATDIVTGEKIIFKEGSVVPAVRASATLPGLFEPVEYRHRFLVDGGVVDNLPCDVAKNMGADIIIAVNVEGDFARNKVSNTFMILTQSVNIQGRILLQDSLKKSDIVISPNVGDVSTIDLDRSDDCVKAGILAARESMPAIKKLLIEKTSNKELFK